MRQIKKGIQSYKDARVTTAGPGQLVVMLYDMAIKQTNIAISELEKKPDHDIEKVHNAISRVQDIIAELTTSLDFEKGGDIAQELLRLYRFFADNLLEANLKKEKEPLEKILPLIEDLRDAWAEANRSLEAQVGGKRQGVNIAR